MGLIVIYVPVKDVIWYSSREEDTSAAHNK